MSRLHVILSTVHRAIEPNDNIQLGELVFDVNKQVLLIGDGKGHAVKAAEVVIGPHDENAYVKLDGHEKLIPIGLPLCFVTARG